MSFTILIYELKMFKQPTMNELKLCCIDVFKYIVVV